MSVTIVRFPTRQHVGAAKAAGFVYEGHRTGVFVHRNNPTWCARMHSNDKLGVYSGGLRPYLRPHKINLNAIVEQHGSLMNYLLAEGLATDPSQPVIGVFFAGGSAPSGNAVIKHVVLGADNRRAIVIGFEDGVDGLLTGNAVVLQRDLVKGSQRSSAILIGNARTNPSAQQRQQIKDSLTQWGIQGLVAIGGDDTLTTANRLHQIGIPVVGVPKTIDNDVPGTDITFGHESVVSVTAEELTDLLEEAGSRNAWYIAQIMGRKSGSWTMRAAKAAASTAFFIPEMFSIKGINELLGLQGKNQAVDKLLRDFVAIARIKGQVIASVEDLKEKIKQVSSDNEISLDFESFFLHIKNLVMKRKAAGLRYGTVAVAEGLMYKIPTEVLSTDEAGRPTRGRLIGLDATFAYDQHGNPRISKLRFADFIANRLTDEKTTTAEALYFGYGPRATSRIVGFDINMSTDFGNRAAEALLDGQGGNMVALQNSQIVLVPFGTLPLDETGHIIPRVVSLHDTAFLSAIEQMLNKAEEH